MNDRIVLDPSIHHGKPVIKGTRVPVSTVIGALAGGMSRQEVVREYDVEVADIEAAIHWEEEVGPTISASASVFSLLDEEEGVGKNQTHPSTGSAVTMQLAKEAAAQCRPMTTWPY